MESDCEVKIILLGKTDVGKTSLIERFVENKFKDSPLKRSVHKYEKVTEIEGILVKIILWDTSGQDAYYNFIKNYYHIADGAFIIYDVQNANTFSAVSKWLKDFKEVNKSAEILIVGNKAEDGSKRSVTVADVKKIVLTANLDCIEVSAKRNINTDIIFRHLVQKILVSKGILPYSFGFQLLELENSGVYVSSSSVSLEPNRTVNTPITTCVESTEQQRISSTTNTKSTTESLISCVESTEQYSYNPINALNTTESLVHCIDMTGNPTSNIIMPSTTKTLVPCAGSIEHNIITMESALNTKTNGSFPENETYDLEDEKDTSLNDYGFQFISMADVTPNSNEDFSLVDSASSVEKKKRNLFSFFPKKKKKNSFDT